MKRRAFLSMMLGVAGAPLVPWRGLVEPVIVLAGRESPHVCDAPIWCHHPSHFRPHTREEILADIERTFEKIGLRRFTPTCVSVEASGHFSVGGYYGESVVLATEPTFLRETITW